MPAPLSGTKRGRGTGSMRQRRRGTWQVRWEEGSGTTPRYRSQTVHGSKKDAEEIPRNPPQGEGRPHGPDQLLVAGGGRRPQGPPLQVEAGVVRGQGGGRHDRDLLAARRRVAAVAAPRDQHVGGDVGHLGVKERFSHGGLGGSKRLAAISSMRG